jgi:hypothetical protein
MRMSLARQYLAFKADLAGYLDVPFEDFRRRVAPLRRRREWSAAESGDVKALAGEGAGRALRNFFGPTHPAASAALEGEAVEPEPMTRAELDGHMRALTRSCLADGWPPSRFDGFLAYLESDLSPADLAGAPAAPTAVAASGPPPPARDHFAEAYRGAGPAFRRVVAEHLLAARRLAEEGLQK